MKAQTNREKAIVRLKAEREQATDEYFQQGKQYGLEAADNISFQDFKTLEELDNAQSDYRDLDTLIYSLRQDGNFDWLFEEIEENEACPKSFAPNYVEGFLSGVIEFWQDIQSELED